MITFLLTDVEGSTRRWEEQPVEMAAALEAHDALIDDVVAAHHGNVIKTKGEGDSTFSVFDEAPDAVAAAIAAQQRLATSSSLRVRMAIHTGTAETRGGDYYGPTVNRCARLRGAAHGGQVVVSRVVAELVRANLPADASLLDLGVHRLRDLAEPEHVFQLCHPDLGRAFPPLASLDVRLDNIRPALTSFVGRADELAELEQLITSSRLVTLVGPGGAGKTRLAVEVGRQVIGRFPDGVWVVELASVEDPANVDAAVAAVLGVREQPGGTLRDALADALDRRSVLLVLDNCEHVVDAAASVAELALAAHSNTAVLATSRQALQLRGERTFPVRALPEAAELFIERATRLDPHFRLDATTRDAVERICRAVDALPLGVELAAARLDMLSADQIADRLDRAAGDDDRYDVLTASTRNTEDRQRTLANTIAWSYDLLNATERDAFAALAVFPGSFDLGAAEAVVGARALHAVGGLVSKSLLSRVDRRFSMLETIRSFAADKLAGSGRAGDVHDRFATWAASAAGTADLEVLDVESESLLAALRWTSSRRPDDALRIAVGLAQLWQHRAFLTESRKVLEDLLARTTQLQTPARATALVAAGRLARGAGDLAEAAVLAQQALEAATAAGDAATIEDALNDLGATAHLLGDNEQARAYFEQALASARTNGNVDNEAASLGNLAIVAHSAGDIDRSLALNADALGVARASGPVLLARLLDNRAQALEAAGRIAEAADAATEALELVERSGSARQRAVLLLRLGALAHRRGDNDAAVTLTSDAIELFRSLGDELLLASALYDLGTIATKRSDFDDARKLLEEAYERFIHIGHPLGQAALIVSIGELDRLTGDPDAALEKIQRGLRGLDEAQSREGVVEALDLVAAIAAGRGDAGAAARLVGAADALREEIGKAPARDDERPVDIDTLRKLLGDQFEQAVATGARLPAAEAVAFALRYR